jgi:hypothetical protein
MDKNQEIVSLDDIENNENNENIVTITFRKNAHKIKQKYTYVSKTIKNIFEAYPNSTIIPLENLYIDDDILELIIEYMIQQSGKDCEFPRKPLISENLKENMTDINKDWLVNWIDKIYDNGNGRIKLFNLINAANFLDIQGLLHLACAKVASFVVKESIENIIDIFENKENKNNSEN